MAGDKVRFALYTIACSFIWSDLRPLPKHVALAVSEAFAGSDVSGLKCKAVKTADEKHWSVSIFFPLFRSRADHRSLPAGSSTARRSGLPAAPSPTSSRSGARWDPFLPGFLFFVMTRAELGSCVENRRTEGSLSSSFLAGRESRRSR